LASEFPREIRQLQSQEKETNGTIICVISVILAKGDKRKASGGPWSAGARVEWSREKDRKGEEIE